MGAAGVERLRGEHDLEAGRGFHPVEHAADLGRLQRERNPAVSTGDRPSQGTKRAPTDEQGDLLLHRAGVDRDAVERHVVTLVGGSRPGQRRPQGR